jgi:hypothetical protein
VTLFRNRMRDAHDLTHILTGYGRDPLGELCLLAFMNRHSKNLGQLLIVAMSWSRMPSKQRAAVIQAWRNGKKARWMIALDYEALAGAAAGGGAARIAHCRSQPLSGRNAVMKGIALRRPRPAGRSGFHPIFFLILYELTQNLAISVGVGIAVALAQIGWKLARREPGSTPCNGSACFW